MIQQDNIVTRAVADPDLELAGNADYWDSLTAESHASGWISESRVVQEGEQEDRGGHS